MKDPADKWSGSIQSEMMPECSFEVRGKTYKFLYKQRMYGKIARFVAVLGVWNEESCRFEIDDMVDEVISEFDSDMESKGQGSREDQEGSKGQGRREDRDKSIKGPSTREGLQKATSARRKWCPRI